MGEDKDEPKREDLLVVLSLELLVHLEPPITVLPTVCPSSQASCFFAVYNEAFCSASPPSGSQSLTSS